MTTSDDMPGLLECAATPGHRECAASEISPVSRSAPPASEFNSVPNHYTGVSREDLEALCRDESARADKAEKDLIRYVDAVVRIRRMAFEDWSAHRSFLEAVRLCSRLLGARSPL